MSTWPASLPQKPQKSGYNEVAPDPTVIRSTMDTATKVRRRNTDGIEKISCQFQLTDVQADTLRTFWEITLSHGVLLFTWDHPRTGTTYTKWRFTELPVYTPLGSGQLATCQFERLP